MKLFVILLIFGYEDLKNAVIFFYFYFFYFFVIKISENLSTYYKHEFVQLKKIRDQ